MNAQRERQLKQSQEHLRSILVAIAEDKGFDQTEFLADYFVEQGDQNDKLLLKGQQQRRLSQIDVKRITQRRSSTREDR